MVVKDKNYSQDENGVWWYTDKDGAKYFANPDGEYLQENLYSAIYPQFSKNQVSQIIAPSLEIDTQRPMTVSVLVVLGTIATIFMPIGTVILSVLTSTVSTLFRGVSGFSYLSSSSALSNLGESAGALVGKSVLYILLGGVYFVLYLLFTAGLESKKIRAFDNLIIMEIVAFCVSFFVTIIDASAPYTDGVAIFFAGFFAALVGFAVRIIIVLVVGRIRTVDYAWYSIEEGYSLWHYSRFAKYITKLPAGLWMPKGSVTRG
ncbi:MAG: hypothetical protein LBB10_02970 [Bifidobacteriaceae bacterium]|jgi:hypothetical protein|nr:hypothetical protein [Bifidobacteriaceae bacterium]